jgi:transcriptional regulator with XRE-family HTH domain
MSNYKNERLKLKFRNIVCYLERPGNIADFARRVGVSRQVVYLWLKGKHIPSQRTMKRVKNYFREVSDEKYHEMVVARKRADQLERVERRGREKERAKQREIEEKEQLWDDLFDQTREEDEKTKEILF